MTTIQLAGRLLTASADDRVLTYLLAPFGEPGRTNLGKVTLTASSLTIPEDVTGLSVNVEHDPKTPVAKFARVEATDAGYEADVRFLATKAGDDALVEAREGVRTGISVEVDDPVIRGGQMIAGLLSGAGVCVTPAYPSAQLVAADAGDLPEGYEYLADTQSETVSTEELVINGVTYVVKRTNTSKQETTPKNAEQSAESENEDMAPSLTAAAAAPVGLHAATGGTEATPEHTPDEVYKMLASAFNAGGKTKMLAALANVTHDDGDNDGDGLGEITAAPGWLGQVWSDAPYVRKFIPLIATGTLTSYREKGFRLGTKPKVQKYAGNKAEVPTGGMTATPIDYLVERWAHAADLDRRYVDFGDSDVIKAFVEAQVESYKEETDLDVEQYLLSTATAFTPGTVPSGVNAALAAIVDGALDLIAKRLNPTFALVGVDLYRPLMFMTKDEISAFLSQSWGLKSGSVDGFQVIPTATAALAGNVVVGDGSTVRYKELGGGTPVRVEAEHVSHGGRDLGVFGYTSFQVLKAGGVVKADLGGE